MIGKCFRSLSKTLQLLPSTEYGFTGDSVWIKSNNNEFGSEAMVSAHVSNFIPPILKINLRSWILLMAFNFSERIEDASYFLLESPVEVTIWV